MNIVRAIGMAALGTGFTFLMTTVGAAAVFFMRGKEHPRFREMTIGFAAGVMTAASVWSLLLPALEQAEAEAKLPAWLPSAAGILLGMVFLAGLDALLPRLRAQKPQSDTDRRNTLLMTAITLHNVPEGMAVGLAFALATGEESLAAAVTLALGIGLQNMPEGAAISLAMHREQHSRGSAFCAGMLSGIVEPIFGILVVLAAAGCRPLMPWLLSFAAGAMLYVVVEELIPQAHSRAGTCGFVGGFLIMMVLDVALG